ncbi:MAG: hypothetical protein NTV34_03805, partial [Proteobacteria bacterium]|nr:hypothetical protein [Pseudomonadota bacterium]
PASEIVVGLNIKRSVELENLSRKLSMKAPNMRVTLSLVSVLALAATMSCKNRDAAQVKDASGDKIANRKGELAYPLYWTIAFENADYICRRFCSNEPTKLEGKTDDERQIELSMQRQSCSGDIVYRKITAADLAKSDDSPAYDTATVLRFLTDDSRSILTDGSRKNHMARLNQDWTVTVEKFLNSSPSRQSPSEKSGSTAPQLPKGISETTIPEMPEGMSDTTEAEYLCLGTSPKQNSAAQERESAAAAQRPEPRAETANSSSSRNASRNDPSGVSKANALKASGNELKKNFWGRPVETGK